MPSRKALFAICTGCAILTLALTGCSMVSQITDAVQGKKDVFAMQVGDCIKDAASEGVEVTGVKDIRCDDLHDSEVYLIWELDGDKFPADVAYPGVDTLQTEADGGCLSSFETWINAPFDETSLNYFAYFPSEQSWGQGDREMVCLAFDENGPVSGTLEGKGAEHPY